jgi:hypothetical protein
MQCRERSFRALTNSLVIRTGHASSHGKMPLEACVNGRSRLTVISWLGDVSQGDMLGQVSVRHVLVLVRVLKILIGIDWISPHCIANQLAQGQRNLLAIDYRHHARVYLLIDAFDYVVSVLKPIEEVKELGVGSGAHWLIAELYGERKGLSLYYTVNISATGQLSSAEICHA